LKLGENSGKIGDQMSLYVLSAKPSFVDMVKAALKTDQVKSFATTADLLAELLDSNRAKSELIIIELSTTDASRLIDFVKASGPLHQVLVVAVGTEEELRAIEASRLGMLGATVRAPCQAMDLAAVMAKLREQRDNEA
jgi:hypothetical protein